MITNQDLKSKVSEAVNPEEILQLVKKLISIPSHTSLKERETVIAGYLLNLFKSEGIDCYLQEVKDGRSNVIARLKGEGDGTSLMFNGHIDTVPPFGMSNPFSPTVKSGKLYGRGSADMESGVGTMAYALITLKRLGIKLNGDLVFAGVIDEESSESAGTHYIVNHGPKTDVAIVGEPTKLHATAAHKGCDYFEITFKGWSNHSSVPQNGTSAVLAAVEFVKKIEEVLDPKYAELDHPLVGSPTINIGAIQGSSIDNFPYLTGESSSFVGTVPGFCRLIMDVRWTPYQKIDDVTNDVKEIAKAIEQEKDVNVEVNHILPHPAMEISSDHVLVQSVQKNIKETIGEKRPLHGEPFWGDSGLLYAHANTPTLLFGPGDIGCAHSDNEYIDVSELTPATIIYALTALDICGVGKVGK
ncbi:M20 family metallopeptidase [Virgibacillus sp. JSM 102003]|uniref:M20 family metallopeptidase n=1 Tax=Virgibacillus sp. JSM 102003 TaxID=1562108 RepID=UPI0035C1EA5F